MTSVPAHGLQGKVGPSVTGNGVTWYHVHANSPQDLDFIATLFSVNRFDLADCVSQRRLPTVVNRKSYMFALLHFPRFIPEKKTVIPRQLGIFLADKILVTVYQAGLKSIDALFTACAADEGLRNELLEKDAGDVLYRILDVLVDYTFPMLDKTLESLEEVEDSVFDERVSMAKQVNMLRRDVADQRRIFFPMPKLVGEIRIKSKLYSRSDLDLYYEDLHDKTIKVWDTLESAWERVEIFKDTDYVLSTEKTNRILALLTIIFTLSIPATAIGTLYGTNVNLPGGIQTGAWTFLGRFTTLWLIVVASIIPALIMTWYFRRWHWL